MRELTNIKHPDTEFKNILQSPLETIIYRLTADIPNEKLLLCSNTKCLNKKYDK